MFRHYLINGTIFGEKKVTEHKSVCFADIVLLCIFIQVRIKDNYRLAQHSFIILLRYMFRPSFRLSSGAVYWSKT